MTTSPARSLLERASLAFDFDASARARALPHDAMPPPVVKEDGSLRFAANRAASIDLDRLREAGFIVPDAGASTLAEEFRIVKRQLLLAAARDGASLRERMILIASAQPDEGKTFCAVNLALSMASERDHEVLLVDADVARPSVLSTLGLEEGPGLLDALADPAVDIEACVIRTDLGSLSVLPAGRASNEATELIASDRMRAVLDRLAARSERRILIFDSPPALAASPASELAHHAGQVVVVVHADRTTEGDLREAVALLGGCRSIQLLLNGVSLNVGGRRYGYYGYGK